MTMQGLKSKVTQAVNSGDEATILACARDVVQAFDELPHGWPDSWCSFCRKLADALPIFSDARLEVEELFHA